jgi:hypothetical protein
MDNLYQHIAWHPLSQVFPEVGYICLNQHKEELVLGYFYQFCAHGGTNSPNGLEGIRW